MRIQDVRIQTMQIQTQIQAASSGYIYADSDGADLGYVRKSQIWTTT